MITVNDSKEFSLVKEYIYDGNENSLGTLRKCTNISKIYQDNYNQNLGYKIYMFKHNGEKELIQCLHKYGKYVIHTEFPFGVVTYNGVIGQAMPYYGDGITLEKRLLDQHINPYSLLIKVYTAVKELYDNGILYYDIHSKNIMVVNSIIRLIDFDYKHIEFGKNGKIYEEELVNSFLNKLIAFLSFNCRVHTYMPNLDKISSLNDLYEELCHAEEQVKVRLLKK